MGRIIVVENADAVGEAAAAYLLDAATQAVGSRGRFTLALSGGSTPARLYALLAQPAYRDRMPWEATHLYWGDERCVPPESPESNYGEARRILLQRVPLPTEQIHRMHGEDPDPDHAAAAYAALLPDPLDFVLLGIGEDGHTTSLFPGSPAVQERVRRVMAVVGPKPPPHRLTITPPVIAAARAVLVLATGTAKAAAVARALQGAVDPSACPAQLAREGTWLLDRAAGAELR